MRRRTILKRRAPPHDEWEAQIGVIQFLRGELVAELAEDVHQGADPGDFDLDLRAARGLRAARHLPRDETLELWVIRGGWLLLATIPISPGNSRTSPRWRATASLMDMRSDAPPEAGLK